MAMELHIFSDRSLTSIAEWQRAIDAERFPLQLAASVDLVASNGFLPAQLVDKKAGFECFHDDAKSTLDFLGIEKFDHRWKCALGLRWGGDLHELQAAWMAATAYAAATGGVIFDHHEGKVFSPQQAREEVQDIVQDIPAIEAMLANIGAKFPSP